MDEPTDGQATRRMVGWLLAVASPGIFAGLALTLLVNLPSLGLPRHPTSTVIVFGFLGLSTAASVIGGWLASSGTMPRGSRPGAAFILAAIGAIAYLATLMGGAFLFLRRL